MGFHAEAPCATANLGTTVAGVQKGDELFRKNLAGVQADERNAV
jgi:hypothetical protein